MTQRTWRVAIIGSGRMGGLIEDELPPRGFGMPYGHLSAYRAIPGCEVVAVANRGEDRLKRFAARFGIERTYLDYREMVERERPDIVSVTTPSFARAEPIIHCATHGVPAIYAEKGLCGSLAEADAIATAVRENGVAFNWGALRRHHDGYRQVREAIARGDIGEPRHATMWFFTDLIKHHPHTIDIVAMLLGDPAPSWVEGRLVAPDDARVAGRARPEPTYDPGTHRFVPPEGHEIADPHVDTFRVGYASGVEATFLPFGRFELDVVGTEGRAMAWENGGHFGVRRLIPKRGTVSETTFTPQGESPTVCTIRDLINAVETGTPTQGNLDVTMPSVEVQFGVAHSHLEGGRRISLPVVDRSLRIPGG
ncbi:MAG: Gfo/Idh/MocA family protein [Chloroflexota bacterium]|jgi:predicted dehydrogenase